MENNTRKTVLVTGFGPFGEHTVNASWEAVKELEKLADESKQTCDFDLVTEELPVAYDHVSKRIPQLWEKHKPMIVLHLGLSANAKCLTIESKACNKGYCRPDVNDQKCPEEDVPLENLKTAINIDSVCCHVNANSIKHGCEACVSESAGLYLCEYTYYHSLAIYPERTLFVHVPDLDVYSSSQSAKGVYDIICYLIKANSPPL
ncbi:pyroglutamyl-peptidase 1 [Belonocnema kinseyi]|uniref:pyroglutamyl-peptidase 1 n=1 Tax=Belonocnema kinseyi TaxID=2817044 RepID=UPI00143CD62F|nr:pyroglutamyl-peptidase 1 [Belonocnema kinseyi]